MRKTMSCGVLAVALGLAMSQAQGAILASEDFEQDAVDSGFGWVPGSTWSGNGSVSGGVINFGDIGRYFATPIDPFAHGKVFIAVEYAQTDPGNGDSWGGITMYAPPGSSELMFIGNPFNPSDYSVEVQLPGAPDNLLETGVQIGTTLSRITLELDTTVAPNLTYRLWFGEDADYASPADELTAPASSYPMVDPWTHIFFRGDHTNIGDNLIIATTPEEVGLRTVPEPSTMTLLAIIGCVAFVCLPRKCRRV